MSRLKWRRLLFSALSVTLCCAMFACGAAPGDAIGGNAQGTGTANNPPDATQAPAQTQEPDVQSEAPASGKLVSEPLTLTWWLPVSGDILRYMPDFADNSSIKKRTEITGIEVEYVHPAAGQEREKFNLMMASNELTDIVGAPQYYKGGEFQGLYDGVFMDLRPEIPTLAPDYFKLFKDDPEFYREATNDEGQVVAFYSYKPQGDPPFNRFIIREDVLSDMGVGIPETVADYEALFEKMKAAGITPFVPDKKGYEAQLMGMYNIAPNFYKDAENKIHFGQIEPAFKDYLTLMNSWYTKGYISKDFTSIDGLQKNSLFDTKEVGVIVDAIVATYNRGVTQGFKVTSAPYPRLKKGDQLHIETTDIWPRSSFEISTAAISKTCKNPEAAMKLLNWGYTQEGMDILNWGIEGEAYTVQGENRVYTDLIMNNPNIGIQEASHIYKVHNGCPKFVYYDTVAHANLLKSPESLEIRKKWADDPNVDSLFAIPPITLSESESTRKAAIMTDINTYMDEMVLKFIIGTESLDKFDSYVQTIKGMGIDEVIDITQQAYDRYNAKPITLD